MLCSLLNFDKNELARLIRPLERHLFKPLDLTINHYALKAIKEIALTTRAHLDLCDEQFYKHRNLSLALLARFSIGFGAWWTVAKLSTLACSLGLGCLEGALWQAFLIDKTLNYSELLQKNEHLLINAADGVKSKMLLVTDQRLNQLESQQFVDRGQEKFDKHDQQLEEVHRLKSLQLKTLLTMAIKLGR